MQQNNLAVRDVAEREVAARLRDLVLVGGVLVGVMLAGGVLTGRLLRAADAAVPASSPPMIEPSLVIRPPAREVLRFGESIAARGNRIAITAPTDGDNGPEPGSVSIMKLTVQADGSIASFAEAAFSTTRMGDHFGCSVALARDGSSGVWMAAVGADRAAEDTGCVDLFESSASSDGTLAWSSSGTLTAPRPQIGAGFGGAVAFAPNGMNLAVAAMRQNFGLMADAGCVHMFRQASVVLSDGPIDANTPALRSAQQRRWVHAQTIFAPAPQLSGWFGSAIALGEQWLAVGAPGENQLGGEPPGSAEISDVGVVHLYRRSSGDAYQYAGALRSPTPAAFASFGSALDLDGSTLVVGEPGGRVDGVRCGKAWRFDLEDLDAHPSELVPPEPTTGLSFGGSVAVHGNCILVGAPGFDDVVHDGGGGGGGGDATIEDCGRSYLFERSTAQLSAALVAPASTPMALFAYRVTLTSVPTESTATKRTIAVSGHLFVEEESFGPSPGAALFLLGSPLISAADTTSRVSSSNPQWYRSQ